MRGIKGNYFVLILTQVAEHLFSEAGPIHTYTPKSADIDSFIEILVIISGVRRDVDDSMIPLVFSPVSGKWRMRGQYLFLIPFPQYPL